MLWTCFEAATSCHLNTRSQQCTKIHLNDKLELQMYLPIMLGIKRNTFSFIFLKKLTSNTRTIDKQCDIRSLFVHHVGLLTGRVVERTYGISLGGRVGVGVAPLIIQSVWRKIPTPLLFLHRRTTSIVQSTVFY